jgi:uncharacterized protein (TIGR02453 family)
MNFKKIYKFLIDLKLNNNRTWFMENNESYQFVKTEFEQFIEILIPKLKQFDTDIDVNSAKECVFRIYRDVRFSKIKEPYKTNFGAFIARGGRKSSFAGYYVHIEPDRSFIGGGIYMPPPDILKLLRTEIFENIEKFKHIINDAIFKKYFKEIYGDKLKSAPKGFPNDFSDIDLLKYKDYTVIHNTKKSFWTSEKLLNNLTNICKIQYPFNRFLNTAIDRTLIGR